MQLNPESKKISEIFPVKDNIHYNIPIYQRNYSWKADNVETLFQDIVRENYGYYVGNLLVTPSNNNEDYLDVVDGQQRLTTISLYLLGIYYHLRLFKDKFPNIDDPEVENDFNEALIFIRRQLINKENSKTRLLLLDDDQKIYNGLMEIITKSAFDYTQHKNRIMGKRFAEIQELIKSEFFEDGYNEISLINILNFYKKIISMEILRIRVNNLTDAFSIFTSFNAKGLPLTLIDLLKSYYLKQANKEQVNNGLDKWNKLLSYFYDNNQEANSTLVTQFLQNNYDTYDEDDKKTTSSITKSQALKAYDKLFERKGEKYINTLIDKALIFSSFTNNIGEFNDKLNYSRNMIESLDKISKMEATSVYPIMLYTLGEFKNEKIDIRQAENILEFLINYYVRRNVTLRPKASNLRAKSLAAVREMQRNDSVEESKLDIIKKHLKNLATDDDVFIAALKNNIYDINKDTTRLILVDLERKYGNNFNKQWRDTLTDKNDRGQYYWTLEHIMPQNIKSGSQWEQMLIDESGLDSKEQAHNDNVHKLGNLTLTGYNTELSNSEFLDKRDYSDKTTGTFEGLRTPLFLNESIPDRSNRETIEAKSSWTITDINRRNDELIKYVLETYPLDKKDEN